MRGRMRVGLRRRVAMCDEGACNAPLRGIGAFPILSRTLRPEWVEDELPGARSPSPGRFEIKPGWQGFSCTRVGIDSCVARCDHELPPVGSGHSRN